jgi:hypothetical protein
LVRRQAQGIILSFLGLVVMIVLFAILNLLFGIDEPDKVKQNTIKQNISKKYIGDEKIKIDFWIDESKFSGEAYVSRQEQLIECFIECFSIPKKEMILCRELAIDCKQNMFAIGYTRTVREDNTIVYEADFAKNGWVWQYPKNNSDFQIIAKSCTQIGIDKTKDKSPFLY